MLGVPEPNDDDRYNFGAWFGDILFYSFIAWATVVSLTVAHYS